MKKGILLTIALATASLFASAQIVPGGGFDGTSLAPGWAVAGNTGTTASVSLGGGNSLGPHNGARFLVVQTTNSALGIAQARFATTERPTTFEFAYASFPVQTDQFLVSVVLSKWDAVNMKRDTIMSVVIAGPTGTSNPWTVNQTDLTGKYVSAATPDSGFVQIIAGLHATSQGLQGFPNSAVCIDAMKLNNNAVSVPVIFDETAGVTNYPNPATDQTTISYTLVNGSDVNVTVTDITGKTVATLVSGYQAAGRQEVNFDVTALKPGIYFYTVRAGESVETRKMIVTK